MGVKPPRAAGVGVHTLFHTFMRGGGLGARPFAHLTRLTRFSFGSQVGKYLPAKVMEKGLGVVFGGVGLLVLVLEFMT